MTATASFQLVSPALVDMSDSLNLEDAAWALDRALESGAAPDLAAWARRYGRELVTAVRECDGSASLICDFCDQ